MTRPTHPKCGKTYPGGSSAGHCSGCCETFIGLSAFEAHRVGAHGVDRRCEITDKHWTDERGYWHVGAKLTEEQKAETVVRRMGCQRSARRWKVLCSVSVVPGTVAVNGLITSPNHQDSWIDACGYLALGGEIANKRKSQ